MKNVKKMCATCNDWKLLDKFYVSKREKIGVEYQCKECASKRQKKQRDQNWEKILNHYGRKCFCCGETIKRFLTVDHIKGDGADHRRRLNRGRIYAYIVRQHFPKQFRVACMNCNFAIGMGGTCPHNQQS